MGGGGRVRKEGGRYERRKDGEAAGECEWRKEGVKGVNGEIK